VSDRGGLAASRFRKREREEEEGVGLYREWWREKGVRVRGSGDDGRRRGSWARPGLLDGG
jgi:hypothetical protein